MCQRGNAHLATLKSKKYIMTAFLKTLQRLKREWQKSPALRPGNQTAKTWFGLEKYRVAAIFPEHFQSFTVH